MAMAMGDGQWELARSSPKNKAMGHPRCQIGGQRAARSSVPIFERAPNFVFAHTHAEPLGCHPLVAFTHGAARVLSERRNITSDSITMVKQEEVCFPGNYLEARLSEGRRTALSRYFAVQKSTCHTFAFFIRAVGAVSVIAVGLVLLPGLIHHCIDGLLAWRVQWLAGLASHEGKQLLSEEGERIRQVVKVGTHAC